MVAAVRLRGWTDLPPGTVGKEQNWILTNPEESWFSWFRLYGPLQPHFDRTWVLPDFEKIK